MILEPPSGPSILSHPRFVTLPRSRHVRRMAAVHLRALREQRTGEIADR